MGVELESLELREKVIDVRRVAKVGRTRTLSFSALVVVGDGNGYVGAALGKARDVMTAIRKGVEQAKKNLIYVPRMGTTIPYELMCNFGASKVLLKPASPGSGVIAGAPLRAVFEAAGIKDVLTKCIGSRNPINVVWAVMRGLKNLKSPEEVAKLRDKPLKKMGFRPPVREVIEYEEEIESKTGKESHQLPPEPEADREEPGPEEVKPSESS